MIIKRGNVEIMKVIKDDEHELDDSGTREAMDKAAKTIDKDESSSVKIEKAVEN